MPYVFQTARGRGARTLLTAAVALTVVRGATAQVPPRSFEYLYVESNSGDASGGHAAICFAAQCYHFQQEKDRTIRLHRDNAAEFDYRYRLLGNRTIHATRVAVSPHTYDRARAAFQSRLQVQERQFDVLQSLVQDRELLEAVGERAQGTNTVRSTTMQVPASAYFVADTSPGASPFWGVTERAGLIEHLAEQMRAAYGRDCLDRRAAALRAAITQLAPPAAGDPDPEVGRLPVSPAGLATRHRELLSAWLALEVLRAAPPLRPGTFHAPSAAEFALQPAEILVLRGYAAQQAESLVQLLASARPDWGYPMLVGMARLLALEASINGGHLVVLDDIAGDAPVVSAETVARQAAPLMQVRDERRTDFLAARQAFFAAPVRDESALSTLEATANLLAAADRTLTQHVALPLYSGDGVPKKVALRSDWPLPEISDEDLRPAVATARARESRYRAALARLYPYDLFSHNCVTEIFRTMEPALGGASDSGANPDTVRAASAEALGGYVEWQSTLNFIPFVSANAVGNAYHVSARVERPSYRRLILAGMSRQENAWGVDLRESNVLTARSYGYNHADPLFLFFTDTVVLRRPLYGIANLLVGIGGTLTGLALLPIDGGTTLRRGLYGALFSLPELAFVNIRKGSFEWAPRSAIGEACVSSKPAAVTHPGDSGVEVEADQGTTHPAAGLTNRCPILDRCAS